MNNSQVRTALKVADVGSMTKAAEQLGITQPAVKKQIDALEAELGVRLFDRCAQGCSLTKAGEIFYKGMARITREVDSLLEAVAGADTTANELALCVLPGVISPHFAEICRNLAHQHPDVTIRYVPMPYAERPLAIADHRADIGVYFDIPQVLEEFNLKFWPSKRAVAPGNLDMFCLLDPSHPLASRASITPDDLRGERLAAFDSHVFAALFGETEDPCAASNRIRSISNDVFEVLSFCNAGGIYLCRHLTERYETLQRIPLAWNPPAEGFITRVEPSYPTRLFLNAVSRVLADS